MNLLKRFLSFAMFSALLFCSEAKASSYLYAINDSSTGNQIYGFSVNEATGALSALSGFPIATGFNGGGSTNLEMITIDKLNKRLYVINRGSNNISAYSINDESGELTALPFSPIAGIANERVIKVHPSGSPLIVGGDEIASYIITPTSATPAAAALTRQAQMSARRGRLSAAMGITFTRAAISEISSPDLLLTPQPEF